MTKMIENCQGTHLTTPLNIKRLLKNDYKVTYKDYNETQNNHKDQNNKKIHKKTINTHKTTTDIQNNYICRKNGP